MTEAVKAAGLAAIFGARDGARGYKGSPLQAPAFSDALLEDGNKMPTLLRETDGHTWRLADLAEKLSLPLQHGAGAPGEEGFGEDKTLDMLPVTKKAEAPEHEDGETSTAPSTDEAKEDEIATAMDPARPDTAISERKAAGSEKAAATSPSPGSSDAPDTNDAALLRDSAPPASITTTDKTNARQNPQELSSLPEADQPAPPRLTDSAEPSAKTDTRPASTLTAQDGARQDNPSGGSRQDAESGKPPVRVVSVQSAPAPASPFGTSPTSAALISTLEASPAFASAAMEAANAIATGTQRANETLHTLKIQLQPAELGPVTARLSISGDKLLVELQVETAEARQKLNADGEAMTRALRALGYEVDRVTVQQAPGGTNANAGSGTSGREPGFQSAADEGRQGGGTRGEGNRSGERHGTRGRDEDHRDADAGRGLYI
ncbi:flagellar hook-length control protein FliK [Chelativorans alearense]|uniref:flagellar hook-length control protein FliK n=1 Tax=Chelativorans alearense TaxID=2681495 RepID=UPI0013D7E872|nr:flagellar hook-length control protein FliK [Chelativorans alearense]